MISEYLLLFKGSSLFLVKVLIFVFIGLVESYNDTIKMEVHAYFLIAVSVLIVIFNFFIDRYIFYVTFFGILAVVVLYLIIYIVSSGGVGLGDMVFCSFVASIFGIAGGMSVLFLSNWLAAIALLPVYLRKKVSNRTKIPMIPFQYVSGLFIIILMYCNKNM